MSKIKATYVSVWDGDQQVRTSCYYDPQTKTVSDIQISDDSGMEYLDDEFIELPDGTEIRSFYNDDNDTGVGEINAFSEFEPEESGYYNSDKGYAYFNKKDNSFTHADNKVDIIWWSEINEDDQENYPTDLFPRENEFPVEYFDL